MPYLPRLTVFVSLLASTLLLALPAFAAEPNIDWAKVKETWHTLTPEERAAYEAVMPEVTGGTGTVVALGQRLEPIIAADTCGAATNEIGILPFVDMSTTTGLTNDYDIDTSTSCGTTFNSTGEDNVYRVQVDQTCDITAAESAENYDVVLWAVTDCGAGLDSSCVGSSDNGNPESFTFTATAGTDYFLIVDGWNGQDGDYTLTLSESTTTGCQLVPVELMEFSVD